MGIGGKCSRDLDPHIDELNRFNMGIVDICDERKFSGEVLF